MSAGKCLFKIKNLGGKFNSTMICMYARFLIKVIPIFMLKTPAFTDNNNNGNLADIWSLSVGNVSHHHVMHATETSKALFPAAE